MARSEYSRWKRKERETNVKKLLQKAKVNNAAKTIPVRINDKTVVYTDKKSKIPGIKKKFAYLNVKKESVEIEEKVVKIKRGRGRPAKEKLVA